MRPNTTVLLAQADFSKFGEYKTKVTFRNPFLNFDLNHKSPFPTKMSGKGQILAID